MNRGKYSLVLPAALALCCGTSEESPEPAPERPAQPAGMLTPEQFQALIDSPVNEEGLQRFLERINQEDEEEQAQRRAENFITGLTQELQKHDFWIEDFIQQNYTGGMEDGKIAITISDSTDSSGSSHVDAIAQYNEFNDELTLFPNIAGPLQALDAVDHELGHIVLDEVVGSENYSGPSTEEIREFCMEFIGAERFAEMREYKEKYSSFVTVGGLTTRKIMQFRESYTEAYNTLQSLISNERTYLDRHGIDLIGLLNEEEQERYSQAKRDIVQVLTDYHSKVGDLTNVVIEYYTAINMAGLATGEEYSGEEFNANIESLAIEAHQEFVTRTTQIISQIEEIEKPKYLELQVPGTFRPFYGAMHATTEARLEQLHATFSEVCREHILTEGLERRMDEEGHQAWEQAREAHDQRMEEAREALNQARAQSSNICRLRNTTASFGEGITQAVLGTGRALELFDVQATLSRMNAPTTNYEEIFPRIIDAIYSIHTGEITESYYPPEPKDFEFFERFFYNDEQMFRKGMERYRVINEMRSEQRQIDLPEEPASAQFYTGFESYRWPAANIRLSGLHCPEITQENRAIPEEDIELSGLE